MSGNVTFTISDATPIPLATLRVSGSPVSVENTLGLTAEVLSATSTSSDSPVSATDATDTVNTQESSSPIPTATRTFIVNHTQDVPTWTTETSTVVITPNTGPLRTETSIIRPSQSPSGTWIIDSLPPSSSSHSNLPLSSNSPSNSQTELKRPPPLATSSSQGMISRGSITSITPTPIPSLGGRSTQRSFRPSPADIAAIAITPVVFCLLMLFLYRWVRRRSHTILDLRKEFGYSPEMVDVVVPVDPHVPKVAHNQDALQVERNHSVSHNRIRTTPQMQDNLMDINATAPRNIEPAPPLSLLIPSLDSLRDRRVESLPVVGNETISGLSLYDPNTPISTTYDTQPPRYEELIGLNEVRLKGGPAIRTRQ